MDIEDRIKISTLMRYYGKMLTEKQQQIVSMYVDNNLTMAEVSEELNISRQAVKDALDNAFAGLNDYEVKLQFMLRDEKIKRLLEDKLPCQIDMATRLEIISILEE